MRSHKLENQAIEIVAQALTTDEPVTFEGRSPMEVVGFSMTQNCADHVFAQAGFMPGEGRDQVGVVELHDCFAANEVMIARGSIENRCSAEFSFQLLTYDALRLCPRGEAYKMVETGDNTVGDTHF